MPFLRRRKMEKVIANCDSDPTRGLRCTSEKWKRYSTSRPVSLVLERRTGQLALQLDTFDRFSTELLGLKAPRS